MWLLYILRCSSNFGAVDEILWCYVPVMSNTVDMIRVEKYFSQLVRVDKLFRLDIQGYETPSAALSDGTINSNES